jgi:DNA-binding PadR family transcriptional regulator
MAARHGFKWALLGLLAERNAYGYMLVQRCEDVLGDAFHLNPSAIYTSLRALREEGYVRVVGPHPRATLRSPKVIYEITEKGRKAVDEWLSSERFEPVRSDLAAKLALVRPGNAWRVLALLDSAEIECMTMIRVVSERIAHVSGDAWQGPLLRYSQECASYQLDARLRWIRDARAVLEKQIERYRAGKLGSVTD